MVSIVISITFQPLRSNYICEWIELVSKWRKQGLCLWIELCLKIGCRKLLWLYFFFSQLCCFFMPRLFFFFFYNLVDKFQKQHLHVNHMQFAISLDCWLLSFFVEKMQLHAKLHWSCQHINIRPHVYPCFPFWKSMILEPSWY